MRIRSTKIVENYLTEFEEMFNDDMFGPDIVAQTPNPTLTMDGTRIDMFFSPDDGVLASLVPVLESAQESIYFLAYSFTSNQLGEIVRQKAEAGITIAGVMDDEQVRSNQGTEYDPFRQADLDVRIDGIDGLMHHKVFIVDEKIVVLGSYNFSQNAEERNDENLMIIYDPAIAEQLCSNSNVFRNRLNGMTDSLRLLLIFAHPDDESIEWEYAYKNSEGRDVSGLLQEKVGAARTRSAGARRSVQEVENAVTN
jgi:phosphatidylserine/phosphatidylglycerophosphate/cardiolipin synthase-like enzyme